MGWLNSSLSVKSTAGFELDALLLAVVARLRERLAAAEAETAHLKVIGQGDQSYGVANLVSSFSQPELSIASNTRTRSAELVVNARVAIDPAVLESEVRLAVEQVCTAMGLQPTWGTTRSFRPGRPVPTHRLQASV